MNLSKFGCCCFFLLYDFYNKTAEIMFIFSNKLRYEIYEQSFMSNYLSRSNLFWDKWNKNSRYY